MKSFLSFAMFVLGVITCYGQNGMFNVRDFGAVNDGVTLCTKSIQETIDKCAERGGGKVIIPPGSYLTGPLFLKSNICFEVLPGATLLFNDDIANCPIIDGKWEGIERKVYASLFTGFDLSNVSIIGRGTINGQGKKWWDASDITKKIRREKGLFKIREPENPDGCPLKVPRPRLVNLYNCNNVLIGEITFINSPAWTIHPVYCENITVENISIIQPYESPNTDGINPESCKNVRIMNCFVDCGDDCITIKSGYNEDGRRVGEPCENIVISNCTFAHGRSAIGIGSEMSGGVKNVSVSNCVCKDTYRGLRIKTNRERGGTVENIRADNIIMTDVETAVSIDMFYRNRNSEPAPVTEKTPTFRNIHISNITAVNVENSVLITGLPESPVDELSIVNSSFKCNNGFEISFAKNIDLRDNSVNCAKGEIPLRISEAEDVVVDNFGTEKELEQVPVIELNTVKEIFIHDCKVKKGQKLFVHSNKTTDVEISNNWLRDAKIIQE